MSPPGVATTPGTKAAMTTGPAEPPPAGPIDRIKRALDLERWFERMAEVIVKHPLKFILLSALLTGLAASGNRVLQNETRPDKQWVPRGATALEHKEYVDSTWPGELSFNVFIATPKKAGDNLLSAKYVRELSAIDDRIKKLVVDGDAVKSALYPDLSDAAYEDFAGRWTYDETDADDDEGDVLRQKCFAFGPTCGQLSLLEVFGYDGAVIERVEDDDVLGAVNFWGDQKRRCPVSIAFSSSPCRDASEWVSGANEDACQELETSADRLACGSAVTAYCNETCPDARADSCEDKGCASASGFAALSAATANGGRPAAAELEPFQIDTVASSGATGPAKENGRIAGAKAVRGAYYLQRAELVVEGDAEDPISDEWERLALCELGIPAGDFTAADCPGSELLTFTATFSRSLGDEFGSAIQADIASLGIAYVGILLYMALMLSACDPVHSMLGMSIVTVLIVLMAFGSCLGLGGYFGLFNNNLNNNIPFLLLGLGVDDAFVLAGEYARATLGDPSATPEQRVVSAVKYGGVSILITSLTDGLAFLVGSNTDLPALSWFCAFAGIGVFFTFIFQLTFFVPFLLLNAKRAEANRYDLLCCAKSSKEHAFDEPQGGCCFFSCCGIKVRTGVLEQALGRFGRAIMTKPGKVSVLAIFATLLSVGIVGCTRITKDFQLEWFIPDDSYVKTFIAQNDEYFSGGSPFSVYTQEMDYFRSQGALSELGDFLRDSKYVDQDEDIDDWAREFKAYAKSLPQAEAEDWLDNDGHFKDGGTYYEQLVRWYHGAGSAFRSSIQFVDTDCDNANRWPDCKPGEGVAASKLGATLALQFTQTGVDRYNTMVALREQVGAIIPTAFPYSIQFIFWEEIGTIDVELTRNLLICGVVILCVVFLLIPQKRSAVFVILAIFMSVVDLVGFLYWWDVTISSVSTIYILISVGLAVDYSAHIAHMFVVSEGSADERAVRALERIGPSVFNAVCSTMIAVLVLSTSQSYIFRTFFKALFLTVAIGGVHGLVLLPVLLSLFGGAKAEEGSAEAPAAPVPAAKAPPTADVELENAVEDVGGSNYKE